MIELLVGNIASGKTTYSSSSDKPVVSRDDVRYRLGNGDYGFDFKTEHLVSKIVDAELEARLLLGQDVIVDGVHSTVKSRSVAIALAKKYKVPIVCIVFPDRGEYSHVDARMMQNHGNTPRVVWEGVYRRFIQNYEVPTESEGFKWIEFRR